YREPGATLLATETPMEGTTSGGYDAAAANTGDNKFQAYGHSHWHNSLIWGEDLHDIGMAGTGRSYGNGLSRGAGHDTRRAYAPATENITIASCYVAGCYEVGALLDGSLKKYGPEVHVPRTGRIKFGTESNGGFKNITVSNCVFEGCNGIALESVDGALLEDVTFDNITMRDISGSPIFLRLGARMRGPQGIPVGALNRIMLNNIVSYNAAGHLPAIISGIPGHAIEEVKISNLYLQHRGGASKEMAAFQPPEDETK